MSRPGGSDHQPYTFNDVKLQWLALLSQDEALSSTAVVVALYVVTVHYNQYKGKAWPSFATISRATGKSVKTIQRAIKELDGTWFVIERGNGYKHSTTYAPTGSSIEAALKLRRKHDNVVSLHPIKGSQKYPERVSDLSLQGGRTSPPNPETESINEKTARLFVEFGSTQAHAWDGWLKGYGIDGLEGLLPPAVQHGQQGCYLPSRYPPADAQTSQSILQYLRWIATSENRTRTNFHKT